MKTLLPLTLVTLVLPPSLETYPAPEPTKKGMMALAAKHTAISEPKLEGKDEEAVAGVRKDIEDVGSVESLRKMALDGALNELTIMLSGARSLPGLTVASAYLVTEFPENLRVLNLFGSALHTKDEFEDATAVFEFALSLNKKATIIRLNLANCYLDADQDAKAFALLDRLRIDDKDNRAVWKALAAYYFKKGDLANFRECLFKSATFSGYRQKKTEEKMKQVEEDEVKNEDLIGEMERKLNQLEIVLPMTTADILDEDFPDAARQVREQCGKLKKNEMYLLPVLPQGNFNNPHAFTVNLPIVETWAKAALGNLLKLRKQVYVSKGIDPNAPEEVIKVQGTKAAMGDMANAIQMAKQSMKMMQGMPGMSPDKLKMIQTQMDKAMQQFGGMMDEKPIDKTALPGSDTGSMFSQGNWVSFQRIYTSNMAYLRKYWKEYEIKVKDICDQYIEKVGEENKAWNEEWEKLQEEHKSVQWSSRHDGPVDEPCRRSVIQHKRRLNGISDMYYNQWENLFFPDYPQRMKPTLEGFFRICMLYVRNMSDPKVMQREWQKVIESFAMYAEKAVTAIGTGGGFTYHPEVEEEEQELERDIALAREEAVAKGSGFISAWPPPEKGYTEWVDEHFVLDVAAKYLALRITTRDIEFKAAVPGVFSGAKYDFEKDKLSTYTGLGMKLEVGVNVCGVGLGKLQVGGEAYRRTATWDFKNGTYSETESAKAEAAYKAGPLQLAGEFQLDSQLHAKVKGKASMNVSDDNKFFSGGPTAQWEQDLW